MEYNEIVSLMQEMTKMDITRIMIEQDNFKLELEKNTNRGYLAPSPNTEQATYVNTQPIQTPATKQELDSLEINSSKDTRLAGAKKILSPMVGTFYRQPAPDKPAFVSEGDIVKKGQPVCIIEAMKLMNEIESELDGQIMECLVENEEMVEFGQPLFILK